MGRQAWAWRSLVMGHGHGHAWHGWLAMGVGLRGAWGACVGGRSPMAMAGGGDEWGPHTKESIKCIPQSGTLKNQKESLLRAHRAAWFIRFRKMQFPER